MTRCPLSFRGTRHRIPDAERARSEQPVVSCSEWVTAHAEEIECWALDREKPLRLRGGLEPAHLALALSCRLVRDLRAIVRILFRTVDHRRHHGPEWILGVPDPRNAKCDRKIAWICATGVGGMGGAPKVIESSYPL